MVFFGCSRQSLVCVFGCVRAPLSSHCGGWSDFGFRYTHPKRAAFVVDVHQFVGVVLFRGFLSSQLVHNFVHSRCLEPEAPFSVVSLTEWQAKVATSNCIPLAAGAAKNPLVHLVLVVKMTFKSRPFSAGLQTHTFFVLHGDIRFGGFWQTAILLTRQIICNGSWY